MPASPSAIGCAPFEDWGQLFRNKPAKIALLPLLNHIEHGTAANVTRIVEHIPTSLTP